MDRDYYIYNNDVLVAKLFLSVLLRLEQVNLAIVSAILPLVLDESICYLVEKENYTLVNILKIQKNKLVNFKDQYSDALPIMVNGISILLDLKLAYLEDEYLKVGDKELPMVNSDLGKRVIRLTNVFFRLYTDAQNMPLYSLYKQLNIQL